MLPLLTVCHLHVNKNEVDYAQFFRKFFIEVEEVKQVCCYAHFRYRLLQGLVSLQLFSIPIERSMFRLSDSKRRDSWEDRCEAVFDNAITRIGILSIPGDLSEAIDTLRLLICLLSTVFVKLDLTKGRVLAVSGQLAPKTIRPGRLAPKSTNHTMFLLFVFYRGFLLTIQYYMFLLFTCYKRFSAVLK